MSKAAILIEEEGFKNENGGRCMKRTITATILKEKRVVYEDTILVRDFTNESSVLIDFEKWILKLHSEKCKISAK